MFKYIRFLWWYLRYELHCSNCPFCGAVDTSQGMCMNGIDLMIKTEEARGA